MVGCGGGLWAGAPRADHGEYVDDTDLPIAIDVAGADFRATSVITDHVVAGITSLEIETLTLGQRTAIPLHATGTRVIWLGDRRAIITTGGRPEPLAQVAVAFLRQYLYAPAISATGPDIDRAFIGEDIVDYVGPVPTNVIRGIGAEHVARQGWVARTGPQPAAIGGRRISRDGASKNEWVAKLNRNATANLVCRVTTYPAIRDRGSTLVQTDTATPERRRVPFDRAITDGPCTVVQANGTTVGFAACCRVIREMAVGDRGSIADTIQPSTRSQCGVPGDHAIHE